MKLQRNEIWVITLNWNNSIDTIDCVNSLQNQTFKNFSILIVDNGSTDNSPAILKNKFPDIPIIENKKNFGFAKGFNIGINYADSNNAKLFLILNNDTVLDPLFFEKILKGYEDYPDAGVFAPIIYFQKYPEKIWSHGGYINPILLEKRTTTNFSIDSSGSNERTFFTGCCLLVKKETFETVGKFDEKFFLYYEDMDFSLRVYQKKIKMLLLPEAKIWHKVSKSSGGENNPIEKYYMALNSAKYFKKHMRPIQATVIIIYRLGSAILWTFRLLFRFQFTSLFSYWKGLIHGWVLE
ncbi:MAG: hypothetical protein CVU39_04150 [Chloroflexi bacterium HGW-Chloroflexi-10]|nr:MAG: hypothetical protein CVU39_04150 [Chloroflexi bacterium HGW-Chloroflexi-10]